MATKRKKKPRSQADKEYYQRHKEQVQQRKKEQYQKSKEQKKAQALARYHQRKKELATTNNYIAKDIKILLSLKEYSESSKERKGQVADFLIEVKDITGIGLFDISQVQQLELLAGNLRRDYYSQVRQEVRKRTRSWASLSEKERREFLAYLARRRAREIRRKEGEEKELNEEAKEWEKEIERELNYDAFHRERGKIKCGCELCESRKQREKKEEILKELEEEEKTEKVQCANCERMVKDLNEDDICKKCAEEFS